MSTIAPVSAPGKVPVATPGRPRSKRRRRDNRIVNTIGIVLFVIMVFPVYWMVLTSFRRGVDIQQATPDFIPAPGTLGNYRKVFERDFFAAPLSRSLRGGRA